jgi:hypothetical protein
MTYSRESGSFTDGPPEWELQPEIGDRGVCRCGAEVTLSIKYDGVTQGAFGGEAEWSHLASELDADHYPELGGSA